MLGEGVVGRIGFTFLPSWATLFAVVQPAVSTSPAAPLCWVFCRCPRELVGPAGLYVLVLDRHCRCGPWQAIRPLISQTSSFVLGTRKQRIQPLGFGIRVRAQPGDPAPLGLGSSQEALCLERLQRANPAALGLSLLGGRGRPGTESPGTPVGGFGPVGGAASLCCRRSQRFQVWAPLRGFMCMPPVR